MRIGEGEDGRRQAEEEQQAAGGAGRRGSERMQEGVAKAAVGGCWGGDA
jgi:hypothetical protein